MKLERISQKYPLQNYPLIIHTHDRHHPMLIVINRVVVRNQSNQVQNHQEVLAKIQTNQDPAVRRHKKTTMKKLKISQAHRTQENHALVVVQQHPESQIDQNLVQGKSL